MTNETGSGAGHTPAPSPAPGPDDDYTIAEGDTMPNAWWDVCQFTRLTVRTRSSHIPNLRYITFADEFDMSLSSYGPRYIDLSGFTGWDANLPPHAEAPARDAFSALNAAHPETFSTVIGTGPNLHVWLALRLTRLTSALATDLFQTWDRLERATRGLRDGSVSTRRP